MTLEETIERYNDLREWMLTYAKAHREHFTEGGWLPHAIREADITLSFEQDAIRGRGTAYTMQTMAYEWFEFRIPLDLIPYDFKADS